MSSGYASGPVLTYKCLFKMAERREQYYIPTHPASSQVRGIQIPQGQGDTIQYPQFKSLHGKRYKHMFPKGKKHAEDICVFSAEPTA